MTEHSMRHIVSLSGGRDSTALAIHLALTRPEIEYEYCFCDTGRELPSLYRFLNELEGFLGRPIHHLTDYGKTFDNYLERWNYFLPGLASRWCTKHLKLRPFERFVIGREQPHQFIPKPKGIIAAAYIGIRADEERQENFGVPYIDYRYPFVEEGIDKDGVKDILENAGIRMPDFYRWRSTGGCWMCPWQRDEDWRGLKNNHPELYAQALREEALARNSSGDGHGTTWSISRKPLEMITAQKRFDFIDELDEGPDMRPCLICAK